MSVPPSRRSAIVGVSDHGGWAVLVTVAVGLQLKPASDLTEILLDRRRLELVDADLPKIPHHSECQRLPIDEAVVLVERVRASAERHAKLVLDVVAAIHNPVIPSEASRAARCEVEGPCVFSGASITGIALRQCPLLPPTIAECIQNYRAQNVADWVMYRQALAAAGEARGWAVHWFQPKTVFAKASETLGIAKGDLDAAFLNLRKSIGPPWSQDHKLAMAAAIAAAQK